MFFLDKIRKIVEFEKKLEALPHEQGEPIPPALDRQLLLEAKRMGFSDSYIAELIRCSEEEIRLLRKRLDLRPVYKMIDTCASEFESYVPYFYSTYEEENESLVSENPKIIVLGSGPIRIGQGVEFDYSTVHAVKTIQELGYEAIVVHRLYDCG